MAGQLRHNLWIVLQQRYHISRTLSLPLHQHLLVSLAELRAEPALANLVTLQRGNRLSITPVEPADWKRVCKLATKKP